MPLGTTSNHFPSRERLLVGVVGHIAGDVFAGARVDVPRTASPSEDLVETFCSSARWILSRRAGLAWYRLALETSRSERVGQAIAAAQSHFEDQHRRLLEEFGSTCPETHTRYVGALLGGLVLRQFYDPTPTFEPRVAITSLLHGMLSGAGLDSKAPSMTVPDGLRPAGGMGGRRGQVAEAAVAVLAEHGTWGLTHRRVDQAAGVPTGTASNYFRTRDALCRAALDRLMSGRENMQHHLVREPPTSGGELTSTMAMMLRFACGAGKTELTAVLTMCYEAATVPDYRPTVAYNLAEWRKMYVPWLTDLGVPDPQQAAEILEAFDLGLILAQYAAPDPDLDPDHAMQTVVTGLLRPR